MIQHKIPLMLLTLLSINLTACNSVGNVVPQKGLSMEQAYDDMGHTDAYGQSTKSKIQNKPHDFSVDSIAEEINTKATESSDNVQTNPYEEDLKQVRGQVNLAPSIETGLPNTVPTNAMGKNFHKVPNPTLKLFVYPHLAGNDELPVPGYTTAFSAYEKDHYALPTESTC